MKILLVHNFYRYTGGEDAYFLALKKLLTKKGHTVITYTKNSKDKETTSLYQKAFIAKNMFFGNDISSELGDIIRKYKPEIAHFHNVFPLISPTAYQVCSANNIPIIQTIHNFRMFCPKSMLFRKNKLCELCVKKKFFFPAIINKCYVNSYTASFLFASSFFYHKHILRSFDTIDQYIFPSQFSKHYFFKNINLEKRKSTVIPCFVQSAYNGNCKDKENYFLFVGRLSEEKGILPLLDIFSSLKTMKLIVAGNGPLREDVLKYKRFTNIIILPFLPKQKIHRLMAKALCVVIPSGWYETGPIVMIESLIHGIPVIVPDFGSFVERMSESKIGLLYKSNNIENLRKNIIYMFKNSQTFIKEALRKREYYRNYYGEERHYTQLLSVYQSAKRKR